ncbi:MAG TPA: ASCH domain-containing protein [Acidimicrobiia bacterium]|nr:ASCH domain-containing protein [Acidimicrobiia bacterium]
MTPLPEIDDDAVAAFVERFRQATGDPDDGVFADVSCFGDSVELADELIDIVIAGTKRATAGAVTDYEAEGMPLPAVGDRWIACDGSGRPRVVIETTEVRIGPLSSVDEAFAWDEGEGDRTRADWLRMHGDYFARTQAVTAIPFHVDIPVVFERFDVLYQENPSGEML